MHFRRSKHHDRRTTGRNRAQRQHNDANLNANHRQRAADERKFRNKPQRTDDESRQLDSDRQHRKLDRFRTEQHQSLEQFFKFGESVVSHADEHGHISRFGAPFNRRRLERLAVAEEYTKRAGKQTNFHVRNRKTKRIPFVVQQTDLRLDRNVFEHQKRPESPEHQHGQFPGPQNKQRLQKSIKEAQIEEVFRREDASEYFQQVRRLLGYFEHRF